MRHSDRWWAGKGVVIVEKAGCEAAAASAHVARGRSGHHRGRLDDHTIFPRRGDQGSDGFLVVVRGWLGDCWRGTRFVVQPCVDPWRERIARGWQVSITLSWRWHARSALVGGGGRGAFEVDMNES